MVLAPSARASIVLWACHGPSGQPLGVGPLAASSSGDGVARTYGTGCSSQIGTSADGGLLATFGRADPVGGSGAAWLAEVPAGATLNSFALDRATTGFGGAPQPGDPTRYDARTSAGTLESTDLADASNVALAGRATFPRVTGGNVSFALTCGLASSARCAPSTAGTVGVEVSSLALGVSDDAPPRGAVGGVENPVTGPLPLYVGATDSGLGLETATATLAGEAPVTVQLGGPSCAPLSSNPSEVDLPFGADCPTSVSNVPLTLGTSGLDDGPHQLTVTLSDAAGNTTTLLSEEITVVNHAVMPGSSALVSIGSAGAALHSPGFTALGGALRSTACVSPRLSGALTSRPLRVSRLGVAVLWSGTRYLFTGQLTCLRNRRRVGAPIGTVVAIFSLRGHRLARERTGATTYGRRGRFRVLLHPRSSRTIVFQYGGGSSTRRVRIRVLVTSNRSSRA